MALMLLSLALLLRGASAGDVKPKEWLKATTGMERVMTLCVTTDCKKCDEHRPLFETVTAEYALTDTVGMNLVDCSIAGNGDLCDSEPSVPFPRLMSGAPTSTVAGRPDMKVVDFAKAGSVGAWRNAAALLIGPACSLDHLDKCGKHRQALEMAGQLTTEDIDFHIADLEAHLDKGTRAAVKGTKEAMDASADKLKKSLVNQAKKARNVDKMKAGGLDNEIQKAEQQLDKLKAVSKRLEKTFFEVDSVAWHESLDTLDDEMNGIRVLTSAKKTFENRANRERNEKPTFLKDVPDSPAGTRVELTRAVETSNKTQTVKLPRESSGKLVKINNKGNALVDFGEADWHWISKTNTAHLLVNKEDERARRRGMLSTLSQERIEL